MRTVAIFLLAVACTKPATEVAAPAAIIGPQKRGAELVGTRSPGLDGVRWIDPAPKGDRLRLVRWWTDGCTLCSGSAPVLSRIAKEHADDVAVEAIFHDKRGRERIDDTWLRQTAAATGFVACRIGVDPGWGALRRWWLDRGERRFTSVTFLVDAGGAIRLIHTGGTVTPAEGVKIEEMIDYLRARQ
ncbi:MAG: thioredoxin domain-containing protein [Planctomycetota bacterium]|jgi:thiol-disulfide isomerase/thioredoxin